MNIVDSKVIYSIDQCSQDLISIPSKLLIYIGYNSYVVDPK
ncbi:hypothetical protein VCHA44O286_50007 [Vibrio chagasii]|nr:hypothetical protein VCHA44O286_50007 [Vibrio chagasii]